MFRFGFKRRSAEAITGPPAKVSGISPLDDAVHQQLDTTITWDRPDAGLNDKA